MERGLLWLPLLVVFFWLAWSGWNEYQKVEAYKIWAEDFDNAKFDIYSVLGKKDNQVTWGKPTRQGMIDIETFSLEDVQEICLLVNNCMVELDGLPAKGKTAIQFSFEHQATIKIPFTDISLAAKWCNYLQESFVIQ